MGQHEGEHDAVDTTVVGIADARWGVRVQPATKRFAEPGWSYQEVAPRPCSQCGGPLHTLRKPYDSGGRQYRYVALVCPSCPATFTLTDLRVKSYEQLSKPPSATNTAAAPAYSAPSPETTAAVSMPVGAEASGCSSQAGVAATVADVAHQVRWGVRPEPASERFEVPGWWYEEPAPLPCPRCAGKLHALRKLYDGPHRKHGDKPSFLVAVVCPACPATFTLRELGQRSYAALMGDDAATTSRPPHSDAQTVSARRSGATSPLRWLDCDLAPGEVRVRTIPAEHAQEFLTELLSQPGMRVIDGNLGPVPQPATVVERRLLHWCKITDPDAPVPAQVPGIDVRVVLPLAPEFAGLCARLRAAGVPFRQVRYWWEAETISTVGPQGDLVALRASAELAAITPSVRQQSAPALGWPAAAARDSFELVWDVHAQPHDTGWEPVEAAHLVPEQWVRYLPYSTLNPAQAHAAPAVVLDSTPAPPGLAPATACDPGDLAQVAFALVANNPRAFARPRRTIAGVPTSILHPILAEAPRYFDWLATQGHLGTVHPWIAVVAQDLGRRIRWRRLAPTRGSGRLLWICEQMATPAHADTAVPDLFTAARHSGITAPDWPIGHPPRYCRLDQPGYLALLRDRATDTAFTEDGERVAITYPTAATVTLWTGQNYQVTRHAMAGTFEYPKAHDNETHPDMRGVTVFTRRGDHQSLSWLSTYNTIHKPH